MLGFLLDKSYSIEFLQREHFLISKGVISIGVLLFIFIGLLSVFIVYKTDKIKSAALMLLIFYLVIPVSYATSKESSAQSRIYIDDLGGLIAEMDSKGYERVVFMAGNEVDGVRNGKTLYIPTNRNVLSNYTK